MDILLYNGVPFVIYICGAQIAPERRFYNQQKDITMNRIDESRIESAKRAVELLTTLFADVPVLADMVVTNFKEYSEKYPQQRIGQIFCNYICPDYRIEAISDTSLEIMKRLFDIRLDPFFEESTITIKRWEEIVNN